MDEGIERIVKTSTRLRRLCTLLMFALPVAVALVWAFIEHLPLANASLAAPVDETTPTLSRFLAFLASLLPTGVALYALSILRRLFGLYSRGVIFGQENVACFRHLGWSLFAWAGANFLFDALAGVILSFHWKSGTRLLVLNLDGQDLLMIFMGLVVLTVAWVMDQGRRLSEEQELFV